MFCLKFSPHSFFIQLKSYMNLSIYKKIYFIKETYVHQNHAIHKKEQFQDLALFTDSYNAASVFQVLVCVTLHCKTLCWLPIQQLSLNCYLIRFLNTKNSTTDIFLQLMRVYREGVMNRGNVHKFCKLWMDEMKYE